MAEALREVIRKKIEEKRKREEGNEGEKPANGYKDMVEELLQGEGGSFALTEEEMVDFLLALLVAGYETTSTIITLAVKFLTENPSALTLLKVCTSAFLYASINLFCGEVSFSSP